MLKCSARRGLAPLLRCWWHKNDAITRSGAASLGLRASLDVDLSLQGHKANVRTARLSQMLPVTSRRACRPPPHAIIPVHSTIACDRLGKRSSTPLESRSRCSANRRRERGRRSRIFASPERGFRSLQVGDRSLSEPYTLLDRAAACSAKRELTSAQPSSPPSVGFSSTRSIELTVLTRLAKLSRLSVFSVQSSNSIQLVRSFSTA